MYILLHGAMGRVTRWTFPMPAHADNCIVVFAWRCSGKLTCMSILPLQEINLEVGILWLLGWYMAGRETDGGVGYPLRLNIEAEFRILFRQCLPSRLILGSQMSSRKELAIWKAAPVLGLLVSPSLPCDL